MFRLVVLPCFDLCRSNSFLVVSGRIVDIVSTKYGSDS